MAEIGSNLPDCFPPERPVSAGRPGFAITTKARSLRGAGDEAISSDPVGNGKAIEIERRAEVGAGRRLLGLERDAGRVGHSVDRVEEADHTRRVDQSRRTQRRHQRPARSRERGIVVAEHSFGKGDQLVTFTYAAIALRGANDRREIVSLVVNPAARTEQQGMTGGSVETSVERRDARR
jgi:hypothetical protein